MASYDELHLLDDIGDLVDDVYDLEGYGEVRKAYDELSGYDVYRQWIEPELVEKGMSAKARKRAKLAAKAAVLAGAAGGLGNLKVRRVPTGVDREYVANVSTRRGGRHIGAVSAGPAWGGSNVGMSLGSESNGGRYLRLDAKSNYSKRSVSGELRTKRGTRTFSLERDK